MIKKYVKGDNPFYSYAKDLHTTDKIEFEPGLNIIVGSNGCGKTTLFKTLAHMFQCIDMSYAIFKKNI